MISIPVFDVATSNPEPSFRQPRTKRHCPAAKSISAQGCVSPRGRGVSGDWGKTVMTVAMLASFAAGGAARFHAGKQGRSTTARRALGMRHGHMIEACGEGSTRSFGSAGFVGLLAMVGSLAGCASAPLVQGAGLSSYDAMTPSDGLMTKSRARVRKDQVLTAKTVKIVPTLFPAALAPNLSNQQRQLVANAADRALCVRLSDRFKLVMADEPADLLVGASVTQATETNEIAAGVSVATSIGMNFVDIGVPVPTPRIPIGLGSLSMEAEAIDPTGRQQAAMLWARGANVLFSSARVSKTSDAYDLADTFGDDFGSLLVKGESPFGSFGIDLPSFQKIGSTMGLAPKFVACERHGRYPGVFGLVGDQLGLPPEWTDKGARQAAR